MSYIGKGAFERLLMHEKPGAWRTLVPTSKSKIRTMVMVPVDGEFYHMIQRFVDYNITRNPFYHLNKACEIFSNGFMTDTQFHSIKKKCVLAYWNEFTQTFEWIEWYKNYLYQKEKAEAVNKFGDDIIKNYINKQKEELAAGCSKLVFKSGAQIPDEVEAQIMEYMG